MMEICNKGHAPIVFTKYDHRNKLHKCPACEALDELAEMREQLGLNKEPEYTPEQMADEISRGRT